MSEMLFISPSLYGVRTRKSLEMLKAEVEKQAPEIRTEMLDLARLQMDFFDGRDFDSYHADTKSAIDAVMAASVLVIGAPVYQGSIPGNLKNLFDLLPRHALAKKGRGDAECNRLEPLLSGTRHSPSPDLGRNVRDRASPLAFRRREFDRHSGEYERRGLARAHARLCEKDDRIFEELYPNRIKNGTTIYWNPHSSAIL